MLNIQRIIQHETSSNSSHKVFCPYFYVYAFRVKHPGMFITCSINDKGFPGGSVGKESACNEGDMDSIPGLERSPGEGKGYPFMTEQLSLSVSY